MCSASEAVKETVDFLNANGRKVGLVQIHLYRPFSVEHFAAAIPASCKKIAVLDRSKETGSVGEPVYLDVVTALNQAGRKDITVVSRLFETMKARGLIKDSFHYYQAGYNEVGKDAAINTAKYVLTNVLLIQKSTSNRTIKYDARCCFYFHLKLIIP